MQEALFRNFGQSLTFIAILFKDSNSFFHHLMKLKSVWKQDQHKNNDSIIGYLRDVLSKKIVGMQD